MSYCSEANRTRHAASQATTRVLVAVRHAACSCLCRTIPCADKNLRPATCRSFLSCPSSLPLPSAAIAMGLRAAFRAFECRRRALCLQKRMQSRSYQTRVYFAAKLATERSCTCPPRGAKPSAIFNYGRRLSANCVTPISRAFSTTSEQFPSAAHDPDPTVRVLRCGR